MKRLSPALYAAAGIAALGAGVAVNSFLPRRLGNVGLLEIEEPQGNTQALPTRDTVKMPHVEITFLRSGHAVIPEQVAVRGAISSTPRTLAYSAVLIRHPQATFLYDTGLCTNISTYLADQSFFFRKTLANFVFDESLEHFLKRQQLKQSALDFVLLSHLHWDHVSGIPDIRGVPLRVNKLEYDAAQLGLLDMGNGLVKRLMGDNPIEFFECNEPSYQGFRSSHDLFGDGSIVLVPLYGHTAGNTGMFVNRSNGQSIFLLGDAAWVSENYIRPATMHPFIWSMVTSDDATAKQTLIELHRFYLQHPELPLIAMHDGTMQEQFMKME